MSELKNKPENTPFKQQKLKAIQPVYTPFSAAAIFFTVAILFYAFGFPLYVEANKVHEVTKEYTDCTSDICSIDIEISEKIPSPVFFYYKLTNFYQNHRLFVRSRCYSQLRNDKKINKIELEYCVPAKYNRDFEGYYDPTGKTFSSGDVARPCGLVARSVFNDTFEIEGYPMQDDDIVMSNDRDMWVDTDQAEEWRVIDNHLTVWMKISPFSTFRKLWGVIEKDLKKGNITVQVENNFDVNRWSGTKSIVISNSSAFGGKNPFLGIVLIAAGSFCIFFAMMFTLTGIIFKGGEENEDPRTWKFT